LPIFFASFAVKEFDLVGIIQKSLTAKDAKKGRKVRKGNRPAED
jgi:hypothetical protein